MSTQRKLRAFKDVTEINEQSIEEERSSFVSKEK